MTLGTIIFKYNSFKLFNMKTKDDTIQITISKETYEILNSKISMLKASGTNYNELLSHDKAINYILTHRAGSWRD